MDDDSGESINGDDGDDANCSESESIFDCADDKDGAGGDRIGDGDVDINGSSDPNFRDDKTKVGRNANAAVNDGNAIDDGGPNDGVGVDTNDNGCAADDAGTDGDNNDDVGDGDKNDGDVNGADGGSNDGEGGGNDGGDNADGDSKDGGRDDGDDKDDIDFER